MRGSLMLGGDDVVSAQAMLRSGEGRIRFMSYRFMKAVGCSERRDGSGVDEHLLDLARGRIGDEHVRGRSRLRRRCAEHARAVRGLIRRCAKAGTFVADLEDDLWPSMT